MNFNTLDQTLLTLALNEDLGIPWHDATTELLFPHQHDISHAKIVSKHPETIVICGIDWTRTLFTKLSPNCQIHSDFQDGQLLSPGDTLLNIQGDANTLLKGERTALNFLRHLCAVATLTAKYVKCVAHTKLKILDTRKTTPGFRHLEKYAVHCGGGVNHRMGLYDAIMIKDTHIDLLGGIEKALERLPELTTDSLPVIVEIRSIKELDIALSYGAKKINRVLLDNMTPALLKQCVEACHGIFETEASGNLRLNTILKVAETGVNYASIGELTYNAGHVDLSMYSELKI